MPNLSLKDAEYYIDDIAKEQMPYACAAALTKTASAIGNYLAKQSAHQFHTLTAFSKTHKTARIGGKPSPGSSYATLPADKNHGINRMKAVLGNQHWGISEQIDKKKKQWTDQGDYRNPQMWQILFTQHPLLSSSA